MNDFVSPATQAMNLIRKIGDRVSETGEPIRQFHLESEIQMQLFEDLQNDGLIRGRVKPVFRSRSAMNVNLTSKGWKQYKAEKRGEIASGGVAGSYGFIAMKFDDPILDPFVRDVVKPAVKKGTGYDLVDLREASRAGVIDNIILDQIKGAAFVIADLTHDNPGAYSEAGSAIALGKPVIYICERSKFEEKSTHFNTNHRTTVLWSADDPDQFSRELIATLRRSLEDAAKTGP